MDFQKKGALWLWDSRQEGNNQYVAFLQRVTLTDVRQAFLYLCCDTNYALWINGTFVNTGQYLAI